MIKYTLLTLFALNASSAHAGTVFADVIHNIEGIGTLGASYALREARMAEIQAEFDKEKAQEAQR